ncbi:MAG TPA: TerB family tellurite resistance protein [Burkholderiaceae bacterium]|nr:TerB family tellurite resistance protein [Burkholderiaceae bacterium]
MLTAIREFFDRHIGAEATPQDETRAIQLATAALLVEVARIDSESTETERGAVLRAVREKFGLDEAEAVALIGLAEAEVKQASGYYQFTSLVNRHFSPEQKLRVVEMMWRVAYADAELSAHENHLMRRIGDLLHIPHGDYIAAKMRAQQVAG